MVPLFSAATQLQKFNVLWWMAVFTAFLQTRPMSPVVHFFPTLSTYRSIHTLLSHPLFPHLLCFHVLLHICNIRALSCYRTLYEGQLLALIQDLVYLLGGTKLRQTHRTRNACLLWAICLLGFCRTACGSHCGPKLSSPPCSMPQCDTCPWSCSLA